MGRYLIRRTLFMILVLFIISLLTFLIFVKLPPGIRLGGAVGRSTTPEQIEEVRERSASTSPVHAVRAIRQGLVPWPGWFLERERLLQLREQRPREEGDVRALPIRSSSRSGRRSYGSSSASRSASSRRSSDDPLGPQRHVVRADRGVVAHVLARHGADLRLLLQARWAPTSGLDIGASLSESILQGKFVLPWITLAVTSAAFYARMVRGNMLEMLSEDYTRTARAKGLSERRVVYKHGLRAALTPVVTMLGLDIAFLLGGAVIVETVFLPGIGLGGHVASRRHELPGGHGGHDHRRVVHRRREPGRRRDLRVARSARPIQLVPSRCNGGKRADPLLEVSTQSFQHRRRCRERRRRRVVLDHARRDPGHRGGVGLRQVREFARGDGPGQLASRPTSSGRGRLQGPGSADAPRRRDAHDPRRQDLDDLPGPDDLAAPVLQGGRPDRRGRSWSTRRSRKKEAIAAGRRDARMVNIPQPDERAEAVSRTSSPAACGSAR